MKPLLTLGSLMSDKELWQCARQQLTEHGDNALEVAAMKMDAMFEADNRAGYATLAGIALQIAKLGPRAEGAETRH